MVFSGLLLKKINGFFAQTNSNFDLFFIKGQFIRRWKEIVNYSDIAQRLIGVSFFLFHRVRLQNIQFWIIRSRRRALRVQKGAH